MIIPRRALSRPSGRSWTRSGRSSRFRQAGIGGPATAVKERAMGGHRKVQQSTRHRRGQRGGRTTRRALLYGELQVLEAQRDRPLSAGKAVSGPD